MTHAWLCRAKEPGERLSRWLAAASELAAQAVCYGIVPGRGGAFHLGEQPLGIELRGDFARSCRDDVKRTLLARAIERAVARDRSLDPRLALAAQQHRRGQGALSIAGERFDQGCAVGGVVEHRASA